MEIASLTQQDLSPGEYFSELLPLLVAAIPAGGAAVWAKDEQGVPRKVHQHGYPDPELTENPRVAARHQQLIAALLQQSEPALVLPGEGGRREVGPANLSPLRLLLLPLSGAGQSEALIEICQPSEQPSRQDADEDSSQEDLDYARQMCELAGDFLRAHTLRQLRAPHTASSDAAHFLDDLHSSLDLQRTSVAIAAAARSVVDADRALLVLRTSGELELAAFDAAAESPANVRRAPLAIQLAAATLAIGKPLYDCQPTDALPRELGELVACYCRDTGAERLTLLPLTKPAEMLQEEAEPSTDDQRPDGVILLEQSAGQQLAPAARDRLDALVRHSRQALGNAQAAARSPVAHWTDRVARTSWMQKFAHWQSRRRIAVMVGFLLTAVALLPAPSEFSTSALLRPARTQLVRAEANGTVRQVFAHREDDVAAGAPLLAMESVELERQSTELAGRLAAAEQRAGGLQQALLDDTGESSAARNQLASQAATAAAEVTALRAQQNLLLARLQRLTLYSPSAGRVLSADVERELLNRPVEHGEVLMEIADPTGPWQLDVSLAPKQLQRVAEQGADGKAVILRYHSPLASDGWLYARVTEIQPARDSAGGGTVSAVATAPSKAILRGSLPAEVRFHGGYRPLIYLLARRMWQ